MNLAPSVHRGKALAAAACVAMALAMLALTASPVAAGPRVTPDVPDLPAGAMPRLPYVDWQARRIVDGTRRVSISGIQARVISLHKVDGGYLLGRELTTGNDLVLVRSNGARRVLVGGWDAPRRGSLGTGLAVSRHGDKVLVNTARYTGGVRTYVDTRVLSLPGGALLRKRDFGQDAPSLLAFGVDRAMLTIGSAVASPPPEFRPDTRWWNPSSDAVTDLREDAAGESADLSAWQWAVRPYDGVDPYSVQGIPPAGSPDWPVGQEDFRLGPWSLNDGMVAGNNEVTDERTEASSYLVHRSSDGSHLLSVMGNQDPQVTWESDSALLLRTRVAGTSTYQLIRCTLAGSCQRVGPATTDRRGVIIPASRRNS